MPILYKPATVKQLPFRQRGIAIAVSLSFLLLLSVIGISGLRVSMLESRMANNYRDRLVALAAAEAALGDAAKQLNDMELYGETGVIVKNGVRSKVSFAINCPDGFCRRSPTTGELPWENDDNWKRQISYSGQYEGVSRQPGYLLEYLSFTNTTTSFSPKVMQGLSSIHTATVPAWAYNVTIAYPKRKYATDSKWKFVFYDPWNSAADNHKAIFRIVNAWQKSVSDPSVNKDPVTGEVIYTYDYEDIIAHSPGTYFGLTPRAPLSVKFYGDNGNPTGPATYDPVLPNTWCQYQLALNAWNSCSHNTLLTAPNPKIELLNYQFTWHHHLDKFPLRVFWSQCSGFVRGDTLASCFWGYAGSGSDPEISAGTQATQTVLAPPWDTGISYIHENSDPLGGDSQINQGHGTYDRTADLFFLGNKPFHQKRYTRHCTNRIRGDNWDAHVSGCEDKTYHVSDLGYYYGNMLICRQLVDRATLIPGDFKKKCFACDLRESDADGGKCLHYYSCIQSAPNHMQWQPQELLRPGTPGVSQRSQDCNCELASGRAVSTGNAGANGSACTTIGNAAAGTTSNGHFTEATVSYTSAAGPETADASFTTEADGSRINDPGPDGVIDTDDDITIVLPASENGQSGVMSCSAVTATTPSNNGLPIFGGHFSCEPGWRIGSFKENEPADPMGRTEQLNDGKPAEKSRNPMCDFTSNCAGNVTLAIPGASTTPISLRPNVTYTNHYRATSQGYGLLETTRAQMQLLAWLKTMRINNNELELPLPTCGDVEVSPGKSFNFSELVGSDALLPTHNWHLGGIKVYNSALRPIDFPIPTMIADTNTYDGIVQNNKRPGNDWEHDRYFWVKPEGKFYKYVRKYKYMQELGKQCEFWRVPPLPTSGAPNPPDTLNATITCSDISNNRNTNYLKNSAYWYYYDTPTGEPYNPGANTPSGMDDSYSGQPIIIDLTSNFRSIYKMMHANTIVQDSNGNVTANDSLFGSDGGAVIDLVNPKVQWTDSSGVDRQACSPYLGKKSSADTSGAILQVGDSFIRRWPPPPATNSFGISGARSEIRRNY